jgi:hypothetical protein
MERKRFLLNMHPAERLIMAIMTATPGLDKQLNIP